MINSIRYYVENKNLRIVYKWLIAIFLASLFCALTISSSSIWIDEGLTAYIASQRSLGSAFSFVMQYRGSEIQMPGIFCTSGHGRRFSDTRKLHCGLLLFHSSFGVFF